MDSPENYLKIANIFDEIREKFTESQENIDQSHSDWDFQDARKVLFRKIISSSVRRPFSTQTEKTLESEDAICWFFEVIVELDNCIDASANESPLSVLLLNTMEPFSLQTV